MRLFATDSYRLAVRDKVPGVKGISDTEDLLVPARALQELQRAASSLAHDAEIGVTLSDAEICFIVGPTSISSRLIDGNYPSVLQLIPASFPNQLRIAKDTLLTSLRRAKLLAKDSTSSVRLTMKDRNLEIRTQSHDAGDVEDNVDADYTGDEMTIAFNPSFLIDGVEAVSGDEIVPEMFRSLCVQPWCTASGRRSVPLSLDARSSPVDSASWASTNSPFATSGSFAELNFEPDPEAITVLISKNGGRERPRYSKPSTRWQPRHPFARVRRVT